MSTQPSTGRVRSIYEFIKAHRDQFSAQMVCRVLGVAPSGYYAWLQQPISNRAQEDARPLRLIRASFIASHGIYGAPRVFLDLREAGETCSKHRCCAADARSQSARPARLSHAALGSREAVGADPQPAAATIHRDAPQQGVGDGYHLYSDLAGLALPGRRIDLFSGASACGIACWSWTLSVHLNLRPIAGIKVQKKYSSTRSDECRRLGHRSGTVADVFHVHATVKVVLPILGNQSDPVRGEGLLRPENQHVSHLGRDGFALRHI